MKKRKIFIFILLLMTISVGFSNWIIMAYEKNISLNVRHYGTAVCYNANTKKEYTRVEKHFF